MSKSIIEIKTAFEGCANVCDEFMLELNNNKCINMKACERVGKVIAKLSEQAANNPLDDLFADSLDKLNGLGVEE